MKMTLMILFAGLAVTLFATGGMAAEMMGVDIHGFLSQGYLYANDEDLTPDGKDSDFFFHEFGVNFSKELNDKLHFGIQIFGEGFGDMSNNEINIDWAYGDYRFNELLGLRIGQLKTPHGFYNEGRDVDMLRNSVFLPESVYQEISHNVYVHDIYLAIQNVSSRDLYLSLQGLGIYGYWDMHAIGGISYQAAYGTQNIKSNSSNGQRQVEMFTNLIPSNVIPSDSFINEGIDVEYKYAGNVVWDTPLEGLRIGASLDNLKMTVNSSFNRDIVLDLPNGLGTYTLAEKGDAAYVDYKKLENWVYSLEYTWNRMILMGEYIQTNKEYEINMINLVENKKSKPRGWYVGGAYRLFDWFELGSYYSQTRNETPDLNSFLPAPDYFNELDDVSVTLLFDIDPHWGVKLEAHSLRGAYALPLTDNILESQYGKFEESWNLYVVKMTAAF